MSFTIKQNISLLKNIKRISDSSSREIDYLLDIQSCQQWFTGKYDAILSLEEIAKWLKIYSYHAVCGFHYKCIVDRQARFVDMNNRSLTEVF